MHFDPGGNTSKFVSPRVDTNRSPGFMKTVMRHTFLILFLLLFVLTACASSPKWVKPGAGDADFERDRLDCERQAGMDRQLPNDTELMSTSLKGIKNVGRKDQIFEMCLQAKGWHKSAQ